MPCSYIGVGCTPPLYEIFSDYFLFIFAGFGFIINTWGLTHVTPSLVKSKVARILLSLYFITANISHITRIVDGAAMVDSAVIFIHDYLGFYCGLLSFWMQFQMLKNFSSFTSWINPKVLLGIQILWGLGFLGASIPYLYQFAVYKNIFVLSWLDAIYTFSYFFILTVIVDDLVNFVIVTLIVLKIRELITIQKDMASLKSNGKVDENKSQISVGFKILYMVGFVLCWDISALVLMFWAIANPQTRFSISANTIQMYSYKPFFLWFIFTNISNLKTDIAKLSSSGKSHQSSMVSATVNTKVKQVSSVESPTGASMS